MDRILREHLEEYLSRTLRGAQKAELDSYLAKNPQVAGELALYEASAQMLRELRPENAEELELSPSFYAGVMQRIEQERRVPFWMFFLQPAFVRQLVFACLMWLALLGAYTVAFERIDPRPRVADNILLEEPSPVYDVRLGADLDQNRNSMLAVLMASED